MRTRIGILAPATLMLASVAFTGKLCGQCVLAPIRVGRVEGQLLFGFHGQYRVLANGEIRLLEAANTNTVVASEAVNKDGRFRIENVNPGKYILFARSEGLISASVNVEVINSKGASTSKLILVVLAADATRECGGATIKVQSKEQLDRILKVATRP